LGQVVARKMKDRTQSLSIRLTEPDAVAIKSAAERRGQSCAEFVRDAAICTAEEVLGETKHFRMTPEGFADFMEILSASAAPVIQMAELIKRPAPWEPGYVAKQ
jgi:uncharacterized protein (DUF1778 family)